MYLVEVIPFSRSININNLTYFSAKKIKIGSLVSITVRNKKTYGLVVSIESVRKNKTAIKKADFKTKKIHNIIDKSIFDPDFIEASKDIADFFATQVGSILKTFSSNQIIQNIKKLPNKKIGSKKINSEFIIHAVQQNKEDRYSYYKGKIRSALARKQSVFLICPNQDEIKYIKDSIIKGIEEHTVILHSDLKSKDLIESWKKAIEHSKPILIIATPMFLGIPRNDLGVFIFEKERSKSYKTFKMPYINMRTAVEIYAKQKQAELIVGDSLLNIKTLKRIENGEIIETEAFSRRSIVEHNTYLIDMSLEKNKDGQFIFSDKTLNHLDKIADSEKIILIASRTGLSPLVICADCHRIVSCEVCNHTMVLHGGKKDFKENTFICHSCGEQKSAKTKCTYCDSWRLTMLGIGTEFICDFIANRYQDTPVIQVDSTTVKTYKQIKQAIETWKKNDKGSIIVITPNLLPYIHTKAHTSIIVSIDSLFSLPDFTIREQIFHTLINTKCLAKEVTIFQTRKIEDPMFNQAVYGMVQEFYRDEIRERDRFNYPPFTLFITIKASGPKDILESHFESLKKYFFPHEFFVYESPFKDKKGKSQYNGLIKIDRNKWPDKELVEKIKLLTPNFKVTIDAESLL